METAMINEVRDTFAPAQLHPFGKILVSDVPEAFALNLTIWKERPPLKIFASCLVVGVNF
jgi:hypothetical protein